MKFCTKCGAQMEDDAVVCAACEAKAKEAAAENKADFSKAVEGFMNTPDSTAEFTAEDIENNKILSLFAYLGILFLIPLLAAKDSKYARFHANQGIVLFVVDLALGIVGGIIGLIPILGALVVAACGIVILVLAIIGIVNAVTGKAKQLPIIGGIKVLK